MNIAALAAKLMNFYPFLSSPSYTFRRETHYICFVFLFCFLFFSHFSPSWKRRSCKAHDIQVQKKFTNPCKNQIIIERGDSNSNNNDDDNIFLLLLFLK